MKILVLLVMAFLFACAQKEKEVKPLQKKPLYYMPVKGKLKIHGSGFYIKSKCGEFVRAVEEGKVIYAGKDIGSYGWVVIVEQKDGYVSVYGKVQRPWVKAGELVKKRQIIGKVGRVKKWCGVYYEVRNKFGESIEPMLR